MESEMSDDKNGFKDPKAMVLLKQAHAVVVKLQKQLSQADQAIKSAREKEAALMEVAPGVVDKLIGANLVEPSRRDQAIENMKNPVKVARQLADLIDRTQVRPIGSPKSASDEWLPKDPWQQCTDDYCRQLGVI